MQIKDLLARGRPTFSFEFFPPKTEEAARQLEQTIAQLRELKPTFVSVTYGAGGSTRERTIEIVRRVKQEHGIEAMAHLTCVGSTRDDLAAVLEKIGDAGIENVLALRGDPPKGQTEFKAVESGFRFAAELAQLSGQGLADLLMTAGNDDAVACPRKGALVRWGSKLGSTSSQRRFRTRGRTMDCPCPT